MAPRFPGLGAGRQGGGQERPAAAAPHGGVPAARLPGGGGAGVAWEAWGRLGPSAVGRWVRRLGPGAACCLRNLCQAAGVQGFLLGNKLVGIVNSLRGRRAFDDLGGGGPLGRGCLSKRSGMA